MFKLYKVGNETEHCGIPACISHVVDILSSTETLKYLFKRNMLISFVVLAENCKLDSLFNKPGCHVITKVF
jgi:hypothetical protein